MELDQGVADLPLHTATSRTAEVPPTLQVQGQYHVVLAVCLDFPPPKIDTPCVSSDHLSVGVTKGLH